MPTSSTPKPNEVIDAMRSIQTEGDRWRLAEALAQQIPSGGAGFDEIIDEATAAGVAGNLSRTTLRLYRDAAVRWPAGKRVPNVSFSAHREAMILPTIAEQVKLLNALSKYHGPGKVTVASVRRAIAVQQGKPAPEPNGKGTVAQTESAGILADVIAGSPLLITAIGPDTSPANLDKLDAGLRKAMAHVDRLRAKANRKPAAKPAARKPAAKPAAPGRKRTARKPARDLRGL
jgi:hypothetical protein